MTVYVSTGDEMRAFGGDHAPTFDALALIGRKIVDARYGYAAHMTADQVRLLDEFATHMRAAAQAASIGLVPERIKGDEGHSPDATAPLDQFTR